MKSMLNKISDGLQAGDCEDIAVLVQEALDASINPKTILNDGLLHGMNVIGKQFGNHEIFLPDVLLAAKAMHSGLDVLKPVLSGDDAGSIGTVVIGTVKGDLHDIGKNLVSIMLHGAGFEIVDLGKDVSAESFVDTAILHNASIIGLSALLTTTMPEMKKVITLLHERGLSDHIRVIVGGAPVSETFATEIGADGYAHDAARAVTLVKQLSGV
jgi:5-methyltetrahydrofolate--homocysteine methyltransferase